MPTIMTAKNEDKCIGCEMCIMECQRQLKRVGLMGSYIRVLRDIKIGTKFEISLDPKISEIKLRKIIEACPRGVFEELEEHGA